MALVFTTDTATLLRLADAVVATDPVRNTVFGAIAFGAQQRDATGWAAHPAGDPSVLAARSQPYTAVTFTAGWTDPSEVIGALKTLDPPPAAVAGPRETAEAVAAGLGTPMTGRMDERLFRLDTLLAPYPVAGSARVAGGEDADFLAEWYVDFTVEAFGRGYGSAATAAASQDILDEGAVPCLYTDLANSTSNKIYQALGFVPVLDRTMLRFD